MHIEDFDSLIDQALTSYGIEPAQGLEAKIIAEVRSSPVLVKKKASAKWLRLGSGIAAAGLVAVLLIHNEERPGTKPDQTSETSRAISAAPSIATSLAQPETIHSHAVSLTHRRPHAAMVRTASSAAGLTDQEKLLVELAAHHPNEARQLVSIVGQEKPLTIEPLSVQPISTETLKIAALRIEPLR